VDETGSSGTASSRLREARERLGLAADEVARQARLPAPWYHDLEARPDEVFSTLSLAQLQSLGGVLGLELVVILAGDAALPGERRRFEDVTDGLRRRMGSEGLDAEALGDRLGWKIDDVLADPQGFWTFNVDGFRDVCEGAGVNWLAVLASLSG
jgi:hypothetical protein